MPRRLRFAGGNHGTTDCCAIVSTFHRQSRRRPDGESIRALLLSTKSGTFPPPSRSPIAQSQRWRSAFLFPANPISRKYFLVQIILGETNIKCKPIAIRFLKLFKESANSRNRRDSTFPPSRRRFLDRGTHHSASWALSYGWPQNVAASVLKLSTIKRSRERLSFESNRGHHAPPRCHTWGTTSVGVYSSCRFARFNELHV